MAISSEERLIEQFGVTGAITHKRHVLFLGGRVLLLGQRENEAKPFMWKLPNQAP